MDTAPPAHGRFPGIDGLRAFSVALVVVMHGWGTLPGASTSHWAFRAILGNNGPFGVRIFFVISGFLITLLLRRERDRTGGISLAGFYARRVRRILPAYLTYLGFIVALMLLGFFDFPWEFLLFGLVFIMNYESVLIPDDPYLPRYPDALVVKHAWSLSLEEQFYALWPLALTLFGFRRSAVGAVAIVLLSPFMRVLCYYAWPESRYGLWMMTHCASDSIMIGCLAAIVRHDPRFRAAFARFAHPAWPVGILLATWVVSSLLSAKLRGTWLLTAGITVESTAAAFALLWIVEHPASRLTAALSWRPLAHIGLLSYSIYLWQQFFTTLPGTDLLGRFPWNMLAILAAAELSYRLVERPFLQRRRISPEELPKPA